MAATRQVCRSFQTAQAFYVYTLSLKCTVVPTSNNLIKQGEFEMVKCTLHHKSRAKRHMTFNKEGGYVCKHGQTCLAHKRSRDDDF